MSKNDPAERTVRDIRRKTRKQYTAEEKIRIVVSGLRGEESIAALCRREGIAEGLYYSWSKEFLEAGKKRLAGDTGRQATSGEVKGLRQEMRDLKELVAELSLENRLLKKNMIGHGGGEDEVSRIREAGDHPPGRAVPPGVGSTLDKLGIPKTTFYRWYDRFLAFGDAGLEDSQQQPGPGVGTGSRMMSGGRSSILPWRRRNCRPGNWPSGLRTPGATLSRKPRFTGFSRPTA